MDDVLSQGRDREPSRRPRRLAAIAVLGVLAVVIAGHLPRGRAIPPHRPATAVTAGPVQLAGLGSAAAGLLDDAGRPEDAGRPDDAGRPEDAGRSDAVSRSDDAGRSDHASRLQDHRAAGAEVVDGPVEKQLLTGDNSAAAVDRLWTAK